MTVPVFFFFEVGWQMGSEGLLRGNKTRSLNSAVGAVKPQITQRPQLGPLVSSRARQDLASVPGGFSENLGHFQNFGHLRKGHDLQIGLSFDVH